MKHAILYPDARYKSGWCFLHGHDCVTKSEMDDYCRALDPDGTKFRVVQLPFNLENPNPSIGKPISKPIAKQPVIKLTDLPPEIAGKMLALWDDLRKNGV